MSLLTVQVILVRFSNIKFYGLTFFPNVGTSRLTVIPVSSEINVWFGHIGVKH